MFYKIIFLKCIVQSYVQWLQDSDYNPICILCKNLLKDEPTIRLICYGYYYFYLIFINKLNKFQIPDVFIRIDVFHWSCLDKYAAQLPADTAPAGYQCPKCKEGIFPPANLTSPVVDMLKHKLETVSWSRVGLGQSIVS